MYSEFCFQHVNAQTKARETDMEGLLKITVKENKLQTKMDKLTKQIDKLHKIVQEQEAKLRRFKKQKEVVSIHVLQGITFLFEFD